MNERELLQRIAKLEAQVAQLLAISEQKFVRVGGQAPGLAFALPKHPRRWDVLICVDDAETIQWGRPRLTDTPDQITSPPPPPPPP